MPKKYKYIQICSKKCEAYGNWATASHCLMELDCGYEGDGIAKPYYNCPLYRTQQTGHTKKSDFIQEKTLTLRTESLKVEVDPLLIGIGARIEIQCPHCGKQQEYRLYMIREKEVVCEDCSKKFIIGEE